MGESDTRNYDVEEYRESLNRRDYRGAYNLFQEKREELISNLSVSEIGDSYSLFRNHLGKKEADNFRTCSIKTLKDLVDPKIIDSIDRIFQRRRKLKLAV